MDAVIAYGTPLVEDRARIGSVTALGLDETQFMRCGPFRQRSWVTSIVDVTRLAQLLDVVEGRTAKAPSAWIDKRPRAWREGIAFATLDLSGPYRKTFNDSVPDAVQVADPFHVIKLANTKLDAVRRRVQQETRGHRGHRDDALYRGRRLLTKGHERLDAKGEAKLLGFLEAGDPKGEVRMAWHTPRRRCAVSTTRALGPPRATSPSSSRACSSATCPESSNNSAGPCAAGPARSSPGTKHR
jgi:transposase